ncbi:unnamed protein product, partial [Adineta ricciae]
SISEKSVVDDTVEKAKPTRGPWPPLRQATSVQSGEFTTTKSNHEPSLSTDYIKKYNQIEVTSIADEDDENEREKYLSQRASQLSNDRDNKMVSSYTTGGGAENDVIEIHQFSLADIDAYLDIYFDTLKDRLRNYIGNDDQIHQFRVAMKNRINSNSNAREFQNVLLGKMNGEVLSALTMAFPGETPTIMPLSTGPHNSCFTSIRRWLVNKANYIPTHVEECYIEMIGVKNGYRNHGIGAALLECVEQFARQAGANRLTIHTTGQQLRNYFERYGFVLDATDSSSFWKWVLEQQNVEKLTKVLSPHQDDDYTTSSYINESMVESVDEV